MSLNRTHWVLIALIILLGLSLRTYQVQKTPKLEHDDQISILAATAHLGDYENLAGTLKSAPSWVNNASWLALMSTEGQKLLTSNCARTTDDLKAHDIHTPAYF